MKTSAGIVNLYRAYNFWCPTAEDKKKLRWMIREMNNDNCTEQEIAKAIASAIFNGFNYGNW